MKRIVGVFIIMIMLCNLYGCGEKVAHADNRENPVVIPKKKVIDMEFISQTEKYPTGCEAVSAVMALRKMGFDITPEEFIDDYLEKGSLPYEKNGVWYGPDPGEVFVGDPYSNAGYGCYSPVIIKALNRYLSGSGKKALDMQGTTLETLCRRYVAEDVPVIIWATSSMQPVEYRRTWQIPSGGLFQWTTHEHCLVLAGYDTDSYYLHDPQRGLVTYDRGLTAKRYEELGLQAIVITE